MKILVTGGRGFIGSHLVERLEQEKQNVVVADLKDKQPVDITQFEQLKRLFEKNKFAVVVHLAAQTGIRRSFAEPELYERANVLGTINVLECLRKSPETRLVFASSSSVYGDSKVIPFREDDPILAPLSVYAATKRAAELACQIYARHYGIRITILRLFTVYGPNNRRDMAAFTFTRDILDGKPIRLFGEDTRRDFTYVGDIVAGIRRAMEKSVNFEVINLGNSTPVSVRKFIGLIERYAAKKARIIKDKLQPGEAGVTYADITKAKRLLDWQPTTSLEQGVEKLVNWFKLTQA